jgi:hypothetical protein
MRKRYTEEQIAFVFRQAESGVWIAELCSAERLGSLSRRSIAGRRSTGISDCPSFGVILRIRRILPLQLAGIRRIRKMTPWGTP